jgi:ATP-binding cassette subfamily B protein
MVAANWMFARWKVRYDTTRGAIDTKTTAVLADQLSNHEAIDTHAQHGSEVRRFADVARHQGRAIRFVWFLAMAYDAVQSLSISIVNILALLFGVYLWSKGEMTVGTFVLVHTYISGTGDHLWTFGRIVRDVYESFADAKEMAHILATPHEITDPTRPTECAISEPSITFDHVDFRYQDRPILTDCDFRVKPGETVALVGPSGSGKSTIVRLLLRQYDVGEGVVRVDGTDVRSFTRVGLREYIALVPQDPSLFHRTVRENIRYGRSDATDEEVEAAARRANAHDFIETLSKGYDTLVGERGVKLSGGERQRVAIARAFLRNAPILVFDEATSSLDSVSERSIKEALDTLKAGRTTIIIAHRLSTVRQADRILVLDQGAIAEAGTHEELIALHGRYWQLWSTQENGFMKDEDPSFVPEPIPNSED